MVLTLKVSINGSVGAGVWTWDTGSHRAVHRRETVSLYFPTEAKRGSFFLSDGLAFKNRASYI
jgi:hypothetical protein